MTDDLRTRIAAWLSAKRPCRNTTFGCSPNKPCPTCRMDADALIRELRMTHEENNMPTTDEWYRYRYVTEWTADE